MRTFTKIAFVSTLAFSAVGWADSELVGNWIATSGDKSWDRLDIRRDMVVTGYRDCPESAECEGKARFVLTTYGRSKFFAPTHNIGSGKVRDELHGFTATEILEIRGDNLVLNEYVLPSTKPGATNRLLKTTFTRLKPRR